MKALASIILLLAVQNLYSFSPEVAPKSIEAIRLKETPKMDGVLDDMAWEGIPVATNFIQNEPFPGEEASQKTEVKVIYDDQAIYIGATLYDVSSDSIMRQYSERDDEQNTDIFAVFIDTYDDDQNGYGFVVHPTGVQWDARYSQEQGQDVSWNAVWESKVTIDDKNWYVEMKIPYSAIRFPEQESQHWGINFARKIRRIREFSFWNPLDPEVNGFVNQWGQLDGVKDIEAPLRLAFSPYVSSYLEHYPFNSPGLSNISRSFNGGMDLKYGINDAFTVDMTLIPDFGQVQSDNQVLNLSPFEVRFNENRPFFMEGTELFNKGGLFYSRRLGGTPINYSGAYDDLSEGEYVSSNPAKSQLLNATKLSGRNKKGLGIGLFNGVTNNMYATITDSISGGTREVLTDPLTNYNVLVLDQNLKNNSYVTLVNTNVMRSGAFYDANVTAALLKLNDKKNEYSVEASGVLSQKMHPGNTDLGHTANFRVGKNGGNFQWNLGYGEESDTYDPNDLGFLYNNNSRSAYARLRYNIFEPFGIFLKTWSSLSSGYEMLYNPNEFTNFYVNLDAGGLFKNWLSAGMFFITEPIETYDFFEPRVWGRYYSWQSSNNAGGWISSDYRKKVAIDARFNYRKFDADGRYRFNYRVSPRFRFSDKFSMNYSLSINNFIEDEGAAIDLYGAGTIIGDDIIFGKRDQITYENVLNASYIFTNRMGLTFRARHYWSTVTYNSFHVLDEVGHLQTSTYTGLDADGESLHNTSFNAFNIDMVYRWVFSPGSELSLVYKSSLLSFDNNVANSYINNFEQTMQAPQTRSISLKVLYYIDYLSLKRGSRA